MTNATGYSLWLMPSGDTYNKLSKIILQLSRKYSTPGFFPHITLLGGIEDGEEVMVSKTSRLAGLIKSFTVKLTHVDYLNQYFRCLFLRADETGDLMRANSVAREIFNHIQDPKFMPHLSLMYGDFPTDLKEEIIREIGKEFNMSFDVSSVHLFSTNGEPKDWHRVKEFPFK